MSDAADRSKKPTPVSGDTSGDPGSDRARRPAHAPLCDLCGAPMRETHCKLICDRCGYIRDCSDP